MAARLKIRDTQCRNRDAARRAGGEQQLAVRSKVAQSRPARCGYRIAARLWHKLCRDIAQPQPVGGTRQPQRNRRARQSAVQRQRERAIARLIARATEMHDPVAPPIARARNPQPRRGQRQCVEVEHAITPPRDTRR